jgi:hypothetical protein
MSPRMKNATLWIPCHHKRETMFAQSFHILEKTYCKSHLKVFQQSSAVHGLVCQSTLAFSGNNYSILLLRGPEVAIGPWWRLRVCYTMGRLVTWGLLQHGESRNLFLLKLVNILTANLSTWYTKLLPAILSVDLANVTVAHITLLLIRGLFLYQND